MTLAAHAASTPQPQTAQQGLADIAYPGGFVRFATPNDVTRWRIETFHTKERDTLAWIETFAAEDVFVDIGANVGMYTLWAAKTRGVKVFAFEPESQNYAALNLNLFLNALSEQVSAYCMALSDRAGFDSFYLQRFETGGSCHSFGAPLDPNLKRANARFRQGCFAAPLDELVEAGVVPPPTHVKIDVDGLEHHVVAGMASILARPELKSVLVEINGKLKEHQEILAFFADQGFHVDDRQRAASLQTEGYFAGAGNIIFWKDPDAAARLGAVLAGEAAPLPAPSLGTPAGPKLGGLTADDAIDAAIEAIAAAPVQTEPTPYWYCEEVFPASFYAELQANMPPLDKMTSITDLGWVNDHTGKQSNRYVLNFGADDLLHLAPEVADFWANVGRGFRTERFALAMLRKFLPQMAQRFGDDVGQVRFSASAMLLADKGDYALGPHTDRPERVLASLFYLPKTAARPELGTSLYLPKEPGQTCPGGPHHPFEGFVNVATMPYLPNSAFCFFKTDTSFHGVEPAAGGDSDRRLVSYILETNG